MATEGDVSPWFFTYRDRMKRDLAPLTAREREFMEAIVSAAFVREQQLKDMAAFDVVRRLMKIDRREFNYLRNRMLRKCRIKTQFGCIVPVVNWAVNPFARRSAGTRQRRRAGQVGRQVGGVMAKNTEEIGSLLRQLIGSGKAIPDRKLGEIFETLTLKGREIIKDDVGEEGQ